MDSWLKAIYSLALLISIIQVLFVPLISTYALELNIGTYQIGLINGISALAYALLAPLVGIINNKIGEKITIITSLSMISLSYLLLTLAKNFYSLLLLSSMTSGSYALLWPSLESFIGYYKGSASKYSMSWSLGALIGSATASYVLLMYKPIVFLLMGIITALLIMFMLPIKYRKRTNKISLSMFKELHKELHILKLPFIFAAVSGAIMSFYPLIVEIKDEQVLLVSLVFFSMMASRTLAFIAYDRIPRDLKTPLFASLLLLAAIPLSFTSSFLISALISLIMGFGIGLLYVFSLSHILSFSDTKRKVYTGFFESFIGFGFTIGPIIAGVVSSYSLDFSIPVVILLSSVIGIIPTKLKASE